MEKLLVTYDATGQTLLTPMPQGVLPRAQGATPPDPRIASPVRTSRIVRAAPTLYERVASRESQHGFFEAAPISSPRLAITASKPLEPGMERVGTAYCGTEERGKEHGVVRRLRNAARSTEVFYVATSTSGHL